EVGEGSLLATHHHRGGRLVPLVVALLEVTRRPFGYRMSVRHPVGPRRIHRGLSPRVPRPGLEPGLIVGRVGLLGTLGPPIPLLRDGGRLPRSVLLGPPLVGEGLLGLR